MDYTHDNLHYIAKNYTELRCYVEDGGRSYWQRVNKEFGVSKKPWTSVILDLVAFDLALKHIGKKTTEVSSSEIKEMVNYLNRRGL